MIGLDTTVVTRCLVQDDPAQAEAASAIFDLVGSHRCRPPRAGIVPETVKAMLHEPGPPLPDRRTADPVMTSSF